MEYILKEYHRNVSDEELLEDIKYVAGLLEKRSITVKEYMSSGGQYHFSTFQRRFGSWINALQQCGMSPEKTQENRKGIPEKELLEDICRVAIKLDKQTINSAEYSEYGKYSRDVAIRRYGSWNQALVAAGLEPFDHPLGGGSKNKVSEMACYEEIERIWTKLGRQPTSTDVRNGISKYSLHIFERRFGSWRKALEAFVSYMNNTENEKSDNIIPERINENASDCTVGKNSIIETKHKTQREIGLRSRFLVFKRDGFKCCMCGRSPSTTPGLELHVDHIIPWTKGGESTIENLQTLCSDCNIGKSNIT